MEAEILEQLYRRYYRSALLYTLSLCGSVPLAEDIVSDAFLKAYLGLPEETPSFSYWLLRVCKNLWLDQLRRQRHLAPSETLETLAAPATPETQYLQTERQRALWNAISALPAPDRELVVLYYVSGMPMTQIAALMGISHAATRQRLSRLRQTLKQRMEEQGYGR